MTEGFRVRVSKLLDKLGEILDISPSQYEAAVDRYEAVGNWLNKDDSFLAEVEPNIYTQGSMRLGTVIKPYDLKDQYDIDLVCELKRLRIEDIEHKHQLMDMVGKRLDQSEIYKYMKKPKPRCWRLEYAEATRFHMDVLPAIPDLERQERARLAGLDYVKEPILITDISEKQEQWWFKSNPKGYYEWFMDRMKKQYDTELKKVAAKLHRKIEDVPYYRIKTTLQRSVQILKRHRDVMFKERKKEPVSVIITTLAAHAYNNKPDIVLALQNIINEMPAYIQKKNGLPYIPNPTRPEENYADSWKDNRELQYNFEEWLDRVKEDFEKALQQDNLDLFIEDLEPVFEPKLVKLAYSRAFESSGQKEAQTEHEPPLVHIKDNAPKPWRP